MRHLIEGAVKAAERLVGDVGVAADYHFELSARAHGSDEGVHLRICSTSRCAHLGVHTHPH